jgi:Outer membrane cobalamin receptor protein
MTKASLWACATALAGSFMFGPHLALAQETPSSQEAQEAPSTGMEEIVVTARKRDERAQDAPISLVVSSGDMLRERGSTKFSDLQTQTPSLHIAPAAIGSTSVIMAMRGLVRKRCSGPTLRS